MEDGVNGHGIDRVVPAGPTSSSPHQSTYPGSVGEYGDQLSQEEEQPPSSLEKESTKLVEMLYV